MKIEVGKYYKTRDGIKAYVTGKSPFETSTPFTVLPENSAYPYVVQEDGMAYFTCLSRTDLVAPWPEEIAVELWAWLHRDGGVTTNIGPPNDNWKTIDSSVTVIGAVKLTGKITKGVFE